MIDRLQCTRLPRQRTILPVYALIAIGGVLAGPAAAQQYPDRPIKVTVGFPAGSGADILCRWIVDGMAKASGATFVVENKLHRTTDIEIQWGYPGNMSSLRKCMMLEYEVTSIDGLQGVLLKVSGMDQNTDRGTAEKKSRPWRGVPIHEIAMQIARDNGWTAKVGSTATDPSATIDVELTGSSTTQGGRNATWNGKDTDAAPRGIAARADWHHAGRC